MGSRSKRSRKRQHQGPSPEPAPVTALPGPAGPRSRGPRTWLARVLVAILAPAFCIGVTELSLRLSRYGHAPGYFLEAADGRTRYANAEFSRTFLGRDLARESIPTVLAAGKPKGTVRIFVLGGSAARGTPQPGFSFSRILEAMLNERSQSRRFEVINTGLTGASSHLVLPIARACARQHPDLFIVYVGHNEIVGPYGPGTVFTGFLRHLWVIRGGVALRSTRLGQLLTSALRSVGWAGAGPREWGGPGMFVERRVPADDTRLDRAREHFRANLADICSAARSAGSPVILCTPIANVRDVPPFASVHRPLLMATHRKEWEQHCSEGSRMEKAGDLAAAMGHYEQAGRIDGEYAALHFRLARGCSDLDRHDLARGHFVRARDLDALRFRADSATNDTIRQMAQSGREGVHLVDTELLAQADGRSEHGLPGWPLLHDHVHLTFQGNHLVAAALFLRVRDLMPDALSKGAAPPSLNRCAELTTYTPFDRCAAAQRTAQSMGRPPFAEEQAALAAARARRLRQEMDPDTMRRVAKTYRAAVDRAPGDLLLRSRLAEVHMSMGAHDAAAGQCRELLRRYPGNTAWQYLLGRALLRAGKTSEAIAQLESLLERRPLHVEALKVLGSALLKSGQDLQGVSAFRKALSIRPHDAGAHFHLARGLHRLRRTDEALAAVRRAVELQPSFADAHGALGVMLARRGRLEEAIAAYRKAVALAPENAASLHNLAKALMRVDRDKEAIEHLNKALKHQADHVRVLFLLGQAHERTGGVPHAIERYEAALRLAERRGDRRLAAAVRVALARCRTKLR